MITDLRRTFQEFLFLSDAAFKLESFEVVLIKSYLERSVWALSFLCLDYCASNTHYIFVGFMNWPQIPQPKWPRAVCDQSIPFVFWQSPERDESTNSQTILQQSSLYQQRWSWQCVEVFLWNIVAWWIYGTHYSLKILEMHHLKSVHWDSWDVAALCHLIQNKYLYGIFLSQVGSGLKSLTKISLFSEDLPAQLILQTRVICASSR